MKSAAAEVIQIIRQTEHHDISKYDESFLMQSLKRRLELTQQSDFSAYLDTLLQSETERTAFLDSLKNHYTEFFRSGLVFSYLEHRILPALVSQLTPSSELRIWSAGCSTGQEPYSLAILLENMAEKQRVPFRYRIIATDLSQDALIAADKGIYNQDAVQNLRLKDMTAYFEHKHESYAVSDRLKKHVSFSRYDLFDPSSANPQESIFGNFDLVMCSNVLLYYNETAQRFILQKLINSMVIDGYLITGEAERSAAKKCAGLCAVSPPNPIFKKTFEVQHEAE
jgi:chemotaxis methyl-accepting protein methylase